MKPIILIGLLAVTLLISCGDIQLFSPDDESTEVTVTGMNDRVIVVNDTITITATSTDNNGTVVMYYWALDGMNYNDSTSIGRIQTRYSNPGIISVLVKARDNNGVWSKRDCINIVVLNNLQKISTMRLLPGGTFIMGSNTGSSDEKPVHSVTISSFYMDSTEVTQKAYSSLIGKNPSSYKGDLNRPVEMLSWYDAIIYCNARSRRDGKDTCYTYTGRMYTWDYCDSLADLACDFSKKGYRLPTEAEWEYACRAGATMNYYWGNSPIDDFTWYRGNSENDSTSHPVATRLPNTFGLYDMSGNVYEWCWDWYSSTYYSTSPLNDPHGPAVGKYHVLRGGAWNDYDYEGSLHSAARSAEYGVTSSCDGFRCVCTF